MIDPDNTQEDETLIPFDEWGEVRPPSRREEIEEDCEP